MLEQSITKGYGIGFIIYEIEEIVAKTSWRSKLNLNNLSIYSENFFAKISNIPYQLDLKFFNTIRNNYLVRDKSKNIAYQINLTVDNLKITKTIKALDPNPDVYKEFNKILFYYLGKNYNSIIQNDYIIDENSIIDINNLNRNIASLNIDNLLSLKEYI